MWWDVEICGETGGLWIRDSKTRKKVGWVGGIGGGGAVGLGGPLHKRKKKTVTETPDFSFHLCFFGCIKGPRAPTAAQTHAKNIEISFKTSGRMIDTYQFMNKLLEGTLKHKNPSKTNAVESAWAHSATFWNKIPKCSVNCEMKCKNKNSKSRINGMSADMDVFIPPRPTATPPAWKCAKTLGPYPVPPPKTTGSRCCTKNDCRAGIARVSSVTSGCLVAAMVVISVAVVVAHELWRLQL